MIRAATRLVFEPHWVKAARLNYVGSENSLIDPFAFPANGDLAGLPPVYVLNAEFDTLRLSGEDFAVRMAAAGGKVQCECLPATVHGFLNTPQKERSADGIARIVRWLKSAKPP